MSNPSIDAVETALPERRISQTQACDLVLEWSQGHEQPSPMSPEKIERLFSNAGVSTRYSIFEPGNLMGERDFGSRSKIYQSAGRSLGGRAARRTLQSAGLGPDDIDMLITVSCTGFTIPSLDALLLNELSFPRKIKRLPIAELGCGAGASALCRARDYLRAYPDQRVLIVATELCTLNFQHSDLSKTQLVSSALFGDGAAGVVLSGDAVTSDPSRPRLMDYRSTFFQDTLDFMGYENSQHGMHIQLSPRIPAHISRSAQSLLGDFLDGHGLDVTQVSKWVLHPGGRAILDAFDNQFSLNGQLSPSRRVLRDYGNLSSTTIYFVLKQVMNQEIPPGNRGLLVAFGPGFTADVGLLGWERPAPWNNENTNKPNQREVSVS